ncbi:MAG: hypothetical protein FWG82_00785 [Oscillospiraceae bacterium]|nr:hypothetical protein [Oscillospiraceae bacterium]
MKKLLSVLLVLALIVLPLAAVVTSASAVIAATTVLRMSSESNPAPPVGPATQPPSGETTTEPPSGETTTEPPIENPVSEVPSESDPTDDSTVAPTPPPSPTPSSPGGTTPTQPTTKASATTAKTDPTKAGALNDTASIVKAYNDAVDKMLASNKQISKTQVTNMQPFDGDADMIKLTSMNFDRIVPGLGTVGDIVKTFLGNGTQEFGPGPAKDHLNKSTLTAADVKSATATAKGGGNSLTINIVNKVNPTPGTGAIGNVTRDFPYEADVRDQIAVAVKDELKGLANVNIATMRFEASNVVLKADISAGGDLTALSLSFDFAGRLEDVNIKILNVVPLGKGAWGETTGKRTLTYKF